ncbi:hypothetical protein [Streptomyces cyaneofuscatus]
MAGVRVGCSKGLKKNADGTYTLTDRTSGAEDTCNANGMLTRASSSTSTR